MQDEDLKHLVDQLQQAEADIYDLIARGLVGRTLDGRLSLTKEGVEVAEALERRTMN